MTKRLFNEDEAAAYLGRSVSAMQSLRYRRKIDYIKKDRHVQYDIKDLDKFIEQGRIPALGNCL